MTRFGTLYHWFHIDTARLNVTMPRSYLDALDSLSYCIVLQPYHFVSNLRFNFQQPSITLLLLHVPLVALTNINDFNYTSANL